MTTFAKRIVLAGSNRSLPPGGKTAHAHSANEMITVSVLLRPKNSLLPESSQLSRGQFVESHGACSSDIDLVREFAHACDLTLASIDVARRTVQLRGSNSALSKAFGVYLSHYQHSEHGLFRGRTGPIMIPEELNGIIIGVLGLDNRPQAQPRFKPAGISRDIEQRRGTQLEPKDVPSSYTPVAVATAYNFPLNGKRGAGQTVAIIELGGGYRSEDLSAYFESLGIGAQPAVVAVSVDGGANNPSTADSADGEVMLDIEVVGAIAPLAKIVVYFAPNTDQGFLDAITTAVHDRQNCPSVISISWGAAERDWTAQSLAAFNQAFQEAAAMGITVCAAAGDNGSADGVRDGFAHVDFPAASPYVLACGGTRLELQGPVISSETVWNDGDGWATGGGVSTKFPLPNYQASSKIPKSINLFGSAGRGLPDVSGNADSDTGYRIRVDGQQLVIGGTSAVAPLMSGLIALINSERSTPVGFIHQQLYQNQSCCRDITGGNNITTWTGRGYSAGVGWDACSGLGVPDGAKLQALLNSAVVGE